MQGIFIKEISMDMESINLLTGIFMKGVSIRIRSRAREGIQIANEIRLRGFLIKINLL